MEDWNLRDYGMDGQLGLEPTMEAYLENTLIWVKEVLRILKPSGSFVINMGDGFIGGGRGNEEVRKNGKAKGEGMDGGQRGGIPSPKIRGGIYKEQQLLSISSFLYCKIISETDFICRGEHIWAKPNVPSPIRSRLKHSHEKLFWFVKDADRYYFEEKPWMKKILPTTKERLENIESYNLPDGKGRALKPFKVRNNAFEVEGSQWATPGKRGCGMNNEETIEHSWRIIPVGAKQSGFELAGKQKSMHVAPYPEELIRPYILGMCPDFVCSVCGKPKEKEYKMQPKLDEKGKPMVRVVIDEETEEPLIGEDGRPVVKQVMERIFVRFVYCACWNPVPATVLDPFLGSGTTMRVAMEEGRNCIGIELSEKSTAYAKKRVNWGGGLNVEYLDKI